MVFKIHGFFNKLSLCLCWCINILSLFSGAIAAKCTPRLKMIFPNIRNRNPDAEERGDYARWLGRVERRAIIPLKWIILITTLFIWLWGTNWILPLPGVFALFLLYSMFNLALSYLFYFNRLLLSQVRSVCYASYFADIIFVAALVYADTVYHFGRAMQSDFYILYFLLIMRGFALFRTAAENIIISSVIALLFVLTLSLQERSFGFMSERSFILKFILIWMVALLSWFIVGILNQQKSELIKIREKLMRSQHLTHLGEISATLAHEINNPIGIIVAYSEYLLRNAKPDDPHRDDFESIRHEALRCEKILSELLNYAKPAVQKICHCQLEQINDEVLALLFREEREENITIHKEYDKELPKVLVDPAQIKQALLNVYLNARQAINGSGKIESIIRKIKLPLPTLGIQNSEFRIQKEGLEILIRDNGKGFTPEALERAFEPFFSTRPGGTGLGLTITKQIIEAHRGKINIRNLSPHGAEIQILLPLSPLNESISTASTPISK